VVVGSQGGGENLNDDATTTLTEPWALKIA
jgi:hypothetical protein